MSHLVWERIHALIPELPGVYIFYDTHRRVLYVGKARNLAHRVASYFTRKIPDLKTRLLVEKIHDIHWNITPDEENALLMENNLIKHYQPPYNILLKDGKTYPYLALLDEPFPRLIITRKKNFSDAQYFGPYADSAGLRNLYKFLQSYFQLRDCKLDLSPKGIKKGYRPCIRWYQKTCRGPCIGADPPDAYQERIAQLKEILQGNWESVEKDLETQIQQAAQQWQFEKAHELKSKLMLLRKQKAQSRVMNLDVPNVEVLGWAHHQGRIAVHHMSLRKGSIVATRLFESKWQEEESLVELVHAVLRTLFVEASLASLVLVPEELPLQEWAWEAGGIDIRTPQSAAEKELVYMAQTNAQSHLQKVHRMRSFEVMDTLEELKNALKLPRLPLHIECIDNSHWQGEALVSAVVVFSHGQPLKSAYRRYQVRGLSVGDDYQAMRQTLRRRFKKRTDPSSWPDLLIIDGGKGQLRAAQEALTELGISFPLCALAKKEEAVFLPSQSEPILLPRHSAALRLLQRIRDETHHQALSYHQKKREKQILDTLLQHIPMIGQKRARRLLQHFGSVEEIQAAPVEALAALVGPQIAQNLKEVLRNHTFTASYGSGNAPK
ncbi:MAG: excinuclease ABC subunit UvrC [Bacteroidia bacterium]